MKYKVLAVTLTFLFLLSLPLTSASTVEKPYVYVPTVPETSLAVIALYRAGDYAPVLEGCEWLMAIKTPFDSWGRVYGAEHEAKFTGLALMALIRGESIARGRYTETINGAAYWLIFKQKPDGSWEDYLGTAIAVAALEEFINSKYVDPNMPRLRDQAKKAVERGRAWLSLHRPKTDAEFAFGAIALRNRDLVEKMNETAFKYFALSYLGSHPEVPSNYSPKGPLETALLLYATGDEKYLKELLSMEHFGFWGTLRYNPVELLEASYVSGFSEMREIACPYLEQIRPQLRFEWERVVYAKYFLSCGMDVELPNESAYSSLKPWQIAEIARIKAILGKPYTREVDYLLNHRNGTGWGDFYNTEYVVWVLHDLNVTLDYSPILDSLEMELTNTSPTYYYAYALIVFKEFGRENALNRTLEILAERESPEGGWGYAPGAPAGIKSTSTVLWGLEEAGLFNTYLHRKGWNFLKRALYVKIPVPERSNGALSVENATLLKIRNGEYAGNASSTVEMDSLDGVVYIYTSKNPLAVGAIPVSGFKAESPWRSEKRQYLILVAIVAALGLSFYGIVLFEKGRRERRR